MKEIVFEKKKEYDYKYLVKFLKNVALFALIYWLLLSIEGLKKQTDYLEMQRWEMYQQIQDLQKKIR